MNGPQHFEAAENLAAAHGEWYYAEPDQVPAVLARAQVHATQAMTALLAQILVEHHKDAVDDPLINAWAAAIGFTPPNDTEAGT